MSTPCGGPESLSPFIDLVPPTLTSGWRPCVCIACVCWFEVVLASAGYVCVLLCDKAIQMNVGFWSAVCVCARESCRTQRYKRRKQRRGNDWAVRVTPPPYQRRGQRLVVMKSYQATDWGRRYYNQQQQRILYSESMRAESEYKERERNMWMNHHHHHLSPCCRGMPIELLHHFHSKVHCVELDLASHRHAIKSPIHLIDL